MNEKEVKKEAVNFLKNCSTMVLATSSKKNEPQASTVYFTIDGDLNLYFATSLESRKFLNIKENNKVAFVIGIGPEVMTIQGGGEAKIFTKKDSEKLYEIIEKALKPLDQWPLLAIAKEGYCVFKIKPSWMVWLDLHKEDYKDTINQQNFYKII